MVEISNNAFDILLNQVTTLALSGITDNQIRNNKN